MQTIKSKRDFNRVFSDGRQIRAKHVRMIYSPSSTSSSRIAFIAAKRLGSAPYRNRCKRLLRAAMQTTYIPQGLDVLLFATSCTYTSHPITISSELNELISKIRTTKPPLNS